MKLELVSRVVGKTFLRFQTTVSKHRSFSRHKTTQTLNLDDQKQGRHQHHRGDERISRHLHLLRRLQRESALAAHRASLPLRPRALGSVVHVPAPLAHPQLTIDVIRLPRRRLRDTGRLFRLESRLGRRRLRGFLPEERPRRRRRASRGLRPSARGRIPTNATRQSSRRIATRIASNHRIIASVDPGSRAFIHSFVRSTFARVVVVGGRARARGIVRTFLASGLTGSVTPLAALVAANMSTRRRVTRTTAGHTCVCH